MSVMRLEAASRWYGNVVAVNDVTFEVGAGITGLLGPNGAGKTTLLHMMAGFLRPSAGSGPARRDADLAAPGAVPARRLRPGARGGVPLPDRRASS